MKCVNNESSKKSGQIYTIEDRENLKSVHIQKKSNTVFQLSSLQLNFREFVVFIDSFDLENKQYVFCGYFFIV